MSSGPPCYSWTLLPSERKGKKHRRGRTVQETTFQELLSMSLVDSRAPAQSVKVMCETIVLHCCRESGRVLGGGCGHSFAKSRSDSYPQTQMGSTKRPSAIGCYSIFCFLLLLQPCDSAASICHTTVNVHKQPFPLSITQRSGKAGFNHAKYKAEARIPI